MKRPIFFVFFVLFISNAYAGTFDFSGSLTYHNDVDFFSFNLNTARSNVRIWSDSYKNGQNFDPVGAVWRASGEFVQENDDNDTVNPATQTSDALGGDFGFSFSQLNAGNYILTVGAFDNFRNGDTLADGFFYDDEQPIPIESWWLGLPGEYHVVFDEVDEASPVPVPSTLVLLGIGFAAVVGTSRKKFLR